MFSQEKSRTGHILLTIILLANLFLLSFRLNDKENVVHAQSNQAESPADAIVSLSADKTSFGTTENVILHVIITNPNNYPISILKWNIPSNSITAPLFTVLINGKPAKYLGVLSTRLTPTEQDYITLQAGEQLTRDVNVSSYYDFSASGTYSIVYEVSSEDLYADLTDGFTKSAGHLISNKVDLFIEGRPNPVHKKVMALSVIGSTSFSSCNTSQRSTLGAVRSSASTYTSESLSYFNDGRKGSRYVTWFGVYDPSRYNTVRSSYNAISNAMDTAGINFDCSTTEGWCDAYTVAYVYPAYPYEIYLCSSFWGFNVTGNFSQAGVVVHEMSHFYNVANTDDYEYEKYWSQNLAINNPNLAIKNADSYRLFAENTPPIYESPVVTSITCANLTLTDASSVNFTVTFSAAVTGVDAMAPFNDFSLTTSPGISGVSIVSVSGSGTTYTVTVGTGSRNGTIRLDVIDNNSIMDASSNPLGGTAMGDGSFYNGEIYTIVPFVYKLFLPLIRR